MISFDAKHNFAFSIVVTPPSPATSGTSLTVNSGDGAKFPAVPFNAVVWPSSVQPSTSNAEIVRVTAIVGDTLTITRTQEGTSARSIAANDQIAQNITAKYLTDIETAFQTASASIAPVGSIKMWLTASAPTGWVILDGSNISRSTFSELFGIWGTTFGAGDGSTTFGIPDMRQRIPIGKTTTTPLNILGATSGSWDHTHGPGTLTVASHTHGFGTLSVASHSHGPGTLQVASHTHGPGTLSVASHTHDSGTLGTVGTSVDHTHTYSGITGANNGTQSFDYFAGSNPLQVASDGHTHSYSGTTSNSSNTAHTHAIINATDSASPAVNSGLTASTAPSVTAGATDATAPTVNAGATGATAPAVSTGVTASANPPVYVVNFIARASSAI